MALKPPKPKKKHKTGNAMSVGMKDLYASVDLGNRGVELAVYKGSNHLGDLHISKAKIIWCKGRKPPRNGIVKKWEQLITFFGE
jgi:hypothetical protein